MCSVPSAQALSFAASSARLRDALSNQCLLIVDGALLTSRFGLWLDNVYVRMTDTVGGVSSGGGEGGDENFNGLIQV